MPGGYKTTNQKEYDKLVKEASPNSAMLGPILRAFIVGGIICCIAQAVRDAGQNLLSMEEKDAGTLASITLIALAVILTAIGIFDKLGKFAGGGTFVPITGFANSIASAAMEFRSEGAVLGMGAKLFTVAGPVIVWGVTSAVIYGVIYWLCSLF